MIQLHGYTKASAQELADWKAAEAKKCPKAVSYTLDFYGEYAKKHGISRGEAKTRLWMPMYGSGVNAFKALFQNDPKVGDPSDFSSIEARALAHLKPRFECDTCKDTGEHMGTVCYGGPPIETTVYCIDCGPEKYRGTAVD